MKIELASNVFYLLPKSQNFRLVHIVEKKQRCREEILHITMSKCNIYASDMFGF